VQAFSNLAEDLGAHRSEDLRLIVEEVDILLRIGSRSMPCVRNSISAKLIWGSAIRVIFDLVNGSGLLLMLQGLWYSAGRSDTAVLRTRRCRD